MILIPGKKILPFSIGRDSYSNDRHANIIQTAKKLRKFHTNAKNFMSSQISNNVNFKLLPRSKAKNKFLTAAKRMTFWPKTLTG